MITRRNLIHSGASAAALLALGACSNKFRSYSGPPVTSIQVYKERRRMYLINEQDILASYDFELGFAPTGHKEVEGDGRTPEGAYFIDRKNPNSSFHLSLGISYPNAQDRAKAHALGQSPGGDIFIHGTPRRAAFKVDWTFGCLAVTNRDMEAIYSMVEVGTPIYISA